MSLFQWCQICDELKLQLCQNQLKKRKRELSLLEWNETD